MLATFCQGFGEAAQALVPEGSYCGWPFNEALVMGHFQTTFADLNIIMTLGGGGVWGCYVRPTFVDY